MRFEPRLAGVAVALLGCVGCFEAESKICLKPSGKGTYTNHIAVFAPFDGAADMSAKPDKALLKDLKKSGLSGVKYLPFSTPEAAGYDLLVKFKKPAALRGLAELGIEQDVRLVDFGSGHYRLTSTVPKGSPSKMPKFDGPDADPDMSRFFQGFDAMSSLSKLKLVLVYEVPGTVDRIEPSWGVKQDNTVTWTIDAHRLMAGEKPGNEFSVDFTPKYAFPAKVVDGPTKGVAPI